MILGSWKNMFCSECSKSVSKHSPQEAMECLELSALKVMATVKPQPEISVTPL